MSATKRAPKKKPTTKAKPAPVVDTPEYRANLVSKIPFDVLKNLAVAAGADAWLFAVWRVQDGKIYLDRTATNYPTIDFDKSVAMLAENLRENV